MLRFLFRVVLLLVVLGFVVAVGVGSGWFGSLTGSEPAAAGARDRVNADRVRQTGAEIAERVAEGATKAEAALAEARLTTKIKSKIALDDTLEGSSVDVDTNGTIVTVKGTVISKAQQQRVMQLAEETAGVTSVVNRLEVKSR